MKEFWFAHKTCWIIVRTVRTAKYTHCSIQTTGNI